MGDKEHDFKPLKIEKDGKKVQACQECGALKIGEDTIVVDEDYIELSPLTSDPSLAEGRFWLRSDKDEKRWSPDGTNVEVFSTTAVGGPDLTSIRGFVYLAEGAATDSWYFTAEPSKDLWIRQYSTNACFQPKYQYHGSYAHWTADNTFVDVPNKAANVYGAGEVLSVSQPADGTEVKRWYAGWAGRPAVEGATWDSQYLVICHGPSNLIYQFNVETEDWMNAIATPGNDPSDVTWDGTYYWTCHGASDTVYQIKKDGTEVARWRTHDSPQGITWNGEYHWVDPHYIDWLYKYKPDGTEVDALNFGPMALGECIGWDGKYLYTVFLTDAGAGGGGVCYRYKPDGTIMNAFDSPGPTPESCAWDGKYVFCNDEDSGWVYVFSGSTSFDLNYNISLA